MRIPTRRGLAYCRPAQPSRPVAMNRLPSRLPALLVVLAAGCAPLPDFGAAGGRGGLPPPAGGYPQILPIEALLAQADGMVLDAGLAATVVARAAGLRARAAALRRPVIDSATRARMAAAARRLGGG